MRNLKGTSFDDRLSAAANAKKAELEKFRARSGVNDPAFAERQAARHAIDVARDARTAERKASRLASVAHEAAEKAARDAAAEAEQAARDAEVAREAAHDVGPPSRTKGGPRCPLRRSQGAASKTIERPPSKFGDRPA